MNNQKYEKLMKKCFALAKKGKGKVEPNPYVGAIIYDEKKDEILSFGYHKKFGFAHAEVDAINNLKGSCIGKTIIVNLEPCFHYGKTPPCVDLIIKKGFKKVVISNIDPNIKVRRKSVEKLKQAGIEVKIGILEKEGAELNKVFFKNMTRKMPYVMMKTAVTMDSKIALSNGKSKWITDDYSRNFVQKLRSSYCAIMSASGTILADNPRLNVRYKNKKSPKRIIFDPNNKIPLDYNVFNDDVEVILINNSDIKAPSHVQKISFDGDFEALFKKLYEMGIYSVMIEAGKGLNTELFKAKIIDEINLFMAPKIFGSGISFVDNIELNEIEDCIKLKDLKIKKLKNDLLVNAKIG